MANPSLDQIPSLVKTAILKTTGDRHPDPSTLPDDGSIGDFGFSFFAFSQLTTRFDQIVIVFNPSGEVTEADVENCDKVKDCIELVAKACTQN